MSFNNFNKLCKTKQYCTTPREGDYFKLGDVKCEEGYIYIIVDNKQIARDNTSFRPAIDKLPRTNKNVLMLFDKNDEIRYFVVKEVIYFYSK